MYQVNDAVLYGIYGVCRITKIEKREVWDSKRKEEYYVLKPVKDGKSTLYVPVHNEKAVSEMHPVLSEEEIYSLFEGIPEEDLVWSENKHLRTDHFKEILSSPDRVELVRMIKTLFHQKERLLESGKKMANTDEQFFRDAERKLYEELSHVLGIPIENVAGFIGEQVNKNKGLRGTN